MLSAKDVLLKVRMHGIDTSDLETINSYADSFGNTPIGDLANIAKEDVQTFFFIARVIWPMRECIEFYNEHCGKVAAQLRETEDQRDSYKAKYDVVCATTENYKKNYEELKVQIEKLHRDLEVERGLASLQKQEILELKAKLYDATKK